MIINILKDVLLGMPLVFLAVIGYVHLMLFIARMPNGIKKFILVLLAFLWIVLVILAPFIYLAVQVPADVRATNDGLFAVLFTYILIMTPGLYYFGKVKLKEKLLEINRSRKFR